MEWYREQRSHASRFYETESGIRIAQTVFPLTMLLRCIGGTMGAFKRCIVDLLASTAFRDAVQAFLVRAESIARFPKFLSDDHYDELKTSIQTVTDPLYDTWIAFMDAFARASVPDTNQGMVVDTIENSNEDKME